MGTVIGILMSVFGTNWIITVVVAVIGFFAAKFFKVAGRSEKAKEILILADSITDQLVAATPGAKLPQFLDRAVDQLMKSAGISKEVAARAITASYVKSSRIPYKPVS